MVNFLVNNNYPCNFVVTVCDLKNVIIYTFRIIIFQRVPVQKTEF